MAAPRVSWEKYQLVLAERDRLREENARLRERITRVLEVNWADNLSTEQLVRMFDEGEPVALSDADLGKEETDG